MKAGSQCGGTPSPALDHGMMEPLARTRPHGARRSMRNHAG